MDSHFISFEYIAKKNLFSPAQCKLANTPEHRTHKDSMKPCASALKCIFNHTCSAMYSKPQTRE